MSMKVIGGAMGGVAIPIVIEYVMAGADISPTIPLKWSGAAGIAIGGIDLALVYTKVGPFRTMQPDTKAALVAFGASSLATGIAILALEYLRNSQGYAFQPPAGWRAPQVPIIQSAPQMAQQYTSPVGQVIQEI